MSLYKHTVHTFSRQDLDDPQLCAQGTVSRVFSAQLHGLKVAIKTLKNLDEIAEPSTREHATADFENELVINSQLRHPNILLLIGCIKTSRLESLVFEFSPDGKLNCENYGPSKSCAALNVAIGIARALAYAHQINIMHRDVKPSQVLMFPGDFPKLADWGLAANVSQDGTATGETGTWEYMAPEVIRSEKYNASADVFSFSILLYCMIIGCDFPYVDKYLTPAQIALAIANNKMRPTIRNSVPDCVSTILEACWHDTATNRPTMPEAIQMLMSAEKSLAAKNEQTKTASWLW